MQPQVSSAIDRCERPSLVFDLAAIARTMQHVATAARAADMTPLFAMKSFPHADVFALAAEHLGGFDVASPGELAAAPGRGILSIFVPTGATLAAAPAAASPLGRRVIASCETVEHVRAAPLHAELAIRISASITGRDPAIGALLEGTGHRMSRFGVATRDEVAALVAAAHGRPLGIHIHHGPVTATHAERFIASVTAAIDLLDREPAFVNLGGAWHGISDLGAAFAAIRAAFPRIELLVEPGRTYALDAGFATGHVTSTRELADRTLRVVDISRVCHLRWSMPELVAPPPRAEARRKVMLVGPTCYEEDVIGEWIVEPSHVERRVVLRNITGYAVAWNTSFAGVPAADVVMVS